MTFNKENHFKFSESYGKHLRASMEDNPTMYRFDFDTTHNRMMNAIVSNNFTKDTDAIRKTCKELGIKHTYKAITEYLYA